MFVGFVFLMSSCKKSNVEPTQPGTNFTFEKVVGSVQLPAGSQQSVAGWTVNTGFSASSLTPENSYALDKVIKDFEIAFVSDQTGKDRLLGLMYDGQTDYTINSRSTVLAIIMKLPIVGSLSKQGKIDLINKIENSAEFPALVAKFEEGFNQNKPLFDETNADFINSIATFFDAVAARPLARPYNVDIMTAGKTINFQNPGWAIAQYIGVYKDGKKVGGFSLDKLTWYASSVPELVNAYFDPAMNPIEKSYTMSEDGQYEFRVRTGKPFEGINDDEAKEAFKLNLTNVVIENLGLLTKMIPYIHLKNECLKSTRAFVADQTTSYTSLLSITNGSMETISSFALQIILSTIDLIKTSSECLGVSDLQGGFLEKLKPLLKFVNVVGTIGKIQNDYLFLKNWTNVPAAFDTCLTLTGNAVKACPKTCTQSWMTKNLDVTTYRNGDAIPQVTNPAEWQNTQVGAWCYYNNDPAKGTVYGKLYNWHAISDPRGLAPEGWHIPSDSEWEALMTCLGGSSVAGGKMKSTGLSLWASPNTDATNISGFSGLPGGARNSSGDFFTQTTTSNQNLTGAGGYWWSSTLANTGWQTFCWHLNFESGSVSRYYYDKQCGFSVRCVKD